MNSPFRSSIVFALLFLSLHACRAQISGSPVDYGPVIVSLQNEIKDEMATHRLPSVAIALVDGKHTVWAQGFGFADDARKRPADAHTVFRIGSVSKLFTDIAIMQKVERRRDRS